MLQICRYVKSASPRILLSRAKSKIIALAFSMWVSDWDALLFYLIIGNMESIIYCAIYLNAFVFTPVLHFGIYILTMIVTFYFRDLEVLACFHLFHVFHNDVRHFKFVFHKIYHCKMRVIIQTCNYTKYFLPSQVSGSMKPHTSVCKISNSRVANLLISLNGDLGYFAFTHFTV